MEMQEMKCTFDTKLLIRAQLAPPPIGERSNKSLFQNFTRSNSKILGGSALKLHLMMATKSLFIQQRRGKLYSFRNKIRQKIRAILISGSKQMKVSKGVKS